jgi:hypothetical protein
MASDSSPSVVDDCSRIVEGLETAVKGLADMPEEDTSAGALDTGAA